jgi:hypothetical protein
MPHKKSIKRKRPALNTGKAIAAAIRKVPLSPEEARAWMRDLKGARKMLKPQPNKWDSD